MVTDWLRNPDLVLIEPLLVALLCALVLAASRRALPPTQPRWRLLRALFLVVALAIAVNAAAFALPALGYVEFLPPYRWFGRATIRIAACLLGYGALLGWLLPVVIEGRSLGEMGWRRKRWVRDLAIGLGVGLVLAVVWPASSAVEAVVAAAGGLGSTNLAALVSLPPAFLIIMALTGLWVGWMEENLFRGHLLASLREVGLRGAPANLIQAAVFALSHPVLALLLQGAYSSPTHPAGSPLPYLSAVGAYGMLFAWGLIFGLLRIRTRSLVMPFALHAAFDALSVALSLGSMVSLIAGLLQGLTK